MRSVSIVYRRQYKQQEDEKEARTPALTKRSVDEYYSRLAEREKVKDKISFQKNEMLERMKLTTSKSHRNGDRYNILDSLSIAQISIKKQHETKEKGEQRFSGKDRRAIMLKRNQGCKTVLKGLQLPINYDVYGQQQVEQKNNHCKLKNLFKNKLTTEVKDVIVVLSANFVVNEHFYWQDEQIEDQCARFWKTLQAYATIVWVCCKQDTFKKLQRFSKILNVRLDAVYMIIPKKSKKSLTVSYYLIENDYGIRFHKSNGPLIVKDQKRMIVVSGLNIQTTKNLKYDSFYYSIPIIKNYRSIVHFVKVDMLDRTRLNSVLKILSQECLPQPLHLLDYIIEFEKVQKENEDCQCKIESKYQQPNILEKMEQTKQKYLKFFTQSLSVNLNDRVVYEELQCSVQFLIGDLLRRNYRVHQQYYKYIKEYSQFAQHDKLHKERKQNKKQKKSLLNVRKYRNMAYLWQL